MYFGRDSTSVPGLEWNKIVLRCCLYYVTWVWKLAKCTRTLIWKWQRNLSRCSRAPLFSRENWTPFEKIAEIVKTLKSFYRKDEHGISSNERDWNEQAKKHLFCLGCKLGEIRVKCDSVHLPCCKMSVRQRQMISSSVTFSEWCLQLWKHATFVT